MSVIISEANTSKSKGGELADGDLVALEVQATDGSPAAETGPRYGYPDISIHRRCHADDQRQAD